MVSGAESGQHEFQPHLIVTADGEICCAFYEYGPKTPGGDLLVDLAMAVSYDRGARFASRMVLSERPWDPAVDQPLSRGATRGALGGWRYGQCWAGRARGINAACGLENHIALNG